MFQSKAQQRYLFANKPELAKEFADKTPKARYATLPEHVKPKPKAKRKHRYA